MFTSVVCPEGHVDNPFLSISDRVFKAQGFQVSTPDLEPVPEPIPVEKCEICKGQVLTANYLARYGSVAGF